MCIRDRYTGRSPEDKFIVDTPAVHNKIAWGKVNRPIEKEKFDAIKAKMVAYLQNREIFIFDGMAGADPACTKKFRIVNELASQNPVSYTHLNCKCCRDFASADEISNYFDVGQMGIEHALLPEKGLVVAGDAVIGADSHTCTYGALGAFSTGVGSTDMAAGMVTGKAWFKVQPALKFVLTGKPKKWVSGKDVILHIIGMIGVDGALYKSMEFTGDGVKNLSMDDRFTLCNMAIEAGGKNGIFPVDERSIEYMKEHSKREFKIYEADEDAEYEACLLYTSRCV